MTNRPGASLNPAYWSLLYRAGNSLPVLGILRHNTSLFTPSSAAFTMTLAQGSEIHHERLIENPDRFGEDVQIFLEQGHLISAVFYIRAQRIRSKLLEEAGKLFKRVGAWICDGNTFFCLATNKHKLPDLEGFFVAPQAPALNEIGRAAADCLSRAILSKQSVWAS